MDFSKATPAQAAEIEAVYKQALARIAELQHEEARIIERFLNELKERRLAEVRALIAKTN